MLDKTLSKFIEVTSDAVGTLYKPRAIRNQAKARGFEIEEIARAEVKSMEIKDEYERKRLIQMKKRLYLIETQRQENLESIAEKTKAHLQGETVSEEPVSEEWKSRFFNKAQDIKSEDLQRIWALILATEIRSPESINIRTLDILSNISKEEAKIFEKICSLVSHENLIWVKDHQMESVDNFGISYNDIILMRDAGLIHSSKVTIPSKLPFSHHIGDDHYDLFYKGSNECKEVKFPCLKLTTAGSEIYRILNIPINDKYVKFVVSLRKAKNFEIKKGKCPKNHTNITKDV